MQTVKFIEQLPVWNQRTVIEDAIRQNDVVILEGEGGSGKSTVVPYILYQMGYSVVVTEPRRLPAEALANYMASVLDVKTGEIVGYWHGARREVSKETKLLYCTDGLEVILEIGRELEGKEREYVLVLDEIHEWNNNQEILTAILKAAYSDGKKMKVVILSATMQANELKVFFSNVCKVAFISVPGRLFPVSFNQLPAYGKDPELRIPVDAATYMAINKVREGKNVLMFYPGKKEIYDTIEYLSKEVDAVILPLHGELMPEEQQRCFANYDKPKIVVATNIARTGVTVPGINVVISTGNERRKEVYDGIEGLYLKPISQADCKQEMYRAGRIAEGEYYLCSNTSFEKRDEFSTPEIQRSLLDQLVLRLMSIGKAPEKLEFFHQPDKEAIALARKSLERMGAIDIKNNSVTKIGEALARLPIEARYGRMIMKAEEFGVVDDVIIITAILTMGSLLNYKKATYSYFTTESESDLLAELDIWNRVNHLLWEELENLPINHKNLSRAQTHVRELRDKLLGKVTFGSNGDRKKIVEACLYGMIGDIFIQTGYMESNYRSVDSGSFRLDRNSLCYGSKFVFGVPHTIEYINKKWGTRETMDLISMASSIDIEKVKELLPHCFEEREIDAVYYPEKDCCLVCSSLSFGGVSVSEPVVKEVYDHPRYEEHKKRYYDCTFSYIYRRDTEILLKMLEKQNRQNNVTVAGRTYEIEYEYSFSSQEKPYIRVSSKELFEDLREVEKIQLDDGTLVLVKCESASFNNLNSLRNFIEERKIKAAWEQAQASIAEKKSSKRSVILNWKDFIGTRELYKKMDGTSVIGYQYLQYEKGRYQLKLATEDHPEATGEALQRLFVREFECVLIEKNFKIIGHDGKKLLTKKGSEALSEMQEYVRMLASDVTFENFESSVDEIMEIYNEKLAELKAS